MNRKQIVQIPETQLFLNVAPFIKFIQDNNLQNKTTDVVDSTDQVIYILASKIDLSRLESPQQRIQFTECFEFLQLVKIMLSNTTIMKND